MQDGENSTPEGEKESDSINPGQDSEYAVAASSEETDPKKVYDYYHQHFGVALAGGSDEVRNAEASNRAAYAARTEVADKQTHKSESWNALKSLIRYQTSTAGAAARPISDTISGDSFEAQWFGKTSESSGAAIKTTDLNLPLDAVSNSEDSPNSIEPQEVDGVRLKWTPIVDNVPDRPRQVEESEESLEIEETVARRPAQRPQTAADMTYEEALAATARGEKLGESLAEDCPEAEATLINAQEAPDAQEARDSDDVNQSEDQNIETVGTKSNTSSGSVVDDIDDLLEPTTTLSDKNGSNEPNAAEARSKFGSMNAFAKLQQRTKEQVETKEEQSITGDIPEEVQSEVQAGNWDTKTSHDDAKPDGATVMNQWCSTSTGDSQPAISLADLDNIPTPNIMKEGPPQPKPFSLSTPKAGGTGELTRPTPEAVHQANRASWLKAASEYSSSVIKAVTDQMKMLSSKPKKATPESPEFNTAELPEPPEGNS
ncbi:MAG TPA: hypothetical protein V6C86_18200 [Oculatellaceae cyanobacterium]